MTAIEKMSLLLGSVVSLFAIVSGVWYAAITLGNMSNEIANTNKDLKLVMESLHTYDKDSRIREAQLQRMDQNQKVLMTEVPRLMFVDKGYVLMASPTGEVFRMKRYYEDG